MNNLPLADQVFDPQNFPYAFLEAFDNKETTIKRIKEVEEGIWLVSFMEYDLGYIDLEKKTLQPLDNPFGPKV